MATKFIVNREISGLTREVEADHYGFDNGMWTFYGVDDEQMFSITQEKLFTIDRASEG